MSLTAGTTDQRPYTAFNLLEEACTRAGIKQELFSSEIVEKALDQLNLMFTSLVNRGIQLWKRQPLILPCYVNVSTVPLPTNVNIVDKLTRRTLMRQVGTPFTSAGGNPALAFDGDLDTTTTQTVVNGNIGCMFSQPVQITTAGVLFGAPMVTTGIFFEYTLDGVTWQQIGNMYAGTVAAGEWLWVDFQGAPNALGWRVRVNSVSPFAATEIFFGNTPSEIVLEPWNLDEYNSMPNKTSPGQVINYYQQRDLVASRLLVWPVPNQAAAFDQLCVWVRENLIAVADINQELDVPRRWYDAVTAMLARRLCRSLPEADFSRYDMLKMEETEAVELAEGEERDPSPTNFDMGLSAYTA